MNKFLFFVDHCPVCEQGLVRIRSRIHQRKLEGFCVCDECEAAWKDPSLTERIHRDQLSEEQLWGEQTRWAPIDEICLLGWYSSIQPKSAKSV
jgi:hypothetical protein